MPKTQPFSISSPELSRSLTVTPSQKSGCLCFTVHSLIDPAGTIGITLAEPAIKKLVNRLTLALPALSTDPKPPADSPAKLP